MAWPAGGLSGLKNFVRREAQKSATQKSKRAKQQWRSNRAAAAPPTPRLGAPPPRQGALSRSCVASGDHNSRPKRPCFG